MSIAKQIIAIQDLSGIGRCSLTVIMPVISILGVQPIPVPTAILSSHTGGFSDIVIRDVSDMLPQTLEQYRKLELQPGAVYSGYFALADQISSCIDYFNTFADSIKFVDPVMGDNGSAYGGIGTDIIENMKLLATKADVLTPNITELYLLLDKEYEKNADLASYKIMLRALAAKGAKKILLKGVKLEAGKISNILYCSSDDSFCISNHNYLEAAYPGTGDIFASIYVALLVKGYSDMAAINFAGNFISYVIEYTESLGTDRKFGVELESCLGWLINNEVE